MRALFLRARIASVRQGARRLAGVPPARPGLKARPAARMGRKRRAPLPDALAQPCGSRRKAGPLRRPPFKAFSYPQLYFFKLS